MHSDTTGVPAPAYVICTSPRSGSTLLCRLLAATGVAGAPNSHFHRPSLADWRDTYALDIAHLPEDAQRTRLFAASIVRGKGHTPVFGLRLQRHSFAFFLEQLRLMQPDAPSDKARFDATFGTTRFIHLTRHNKVAQAISYLKAEQTGLWHKAPDGSEIERLAPPAPPLYDAASIQTHRADFKAYDIAWTDWFRTEQIAPLKLTYDTLAQDPLATLAQVLNFIGQDPEHAKTGPLPTARLADATSAEWERRFRANPPSA